MIIMRTTVLVGIITFAFFCGGLAAQRAVPHSVESLSADVHTVLSDGYWSNGGAEGFFRAVVTTAGVEHVNHSLYLQWIKVDLDKDTHSVASSAAIKEINSGQAGGHLINLVHDDTAEFGTFRVMVIVRRERSDGTTRYLLTADGALGAYTIRLTK